MKIVKGFQIHFDSLFELTSGSLPVISRKSYFLVIISKRPDDVARQVWKQPNHIESWVWVRFGIGFWYSWWSTVKVFNRYCLCVTEQTPSEPTGDQGHVIIMSHTLFLACQFGVTHDVNLNLVNCFIWINDEVKRFFTSAKFKFPPSRKFQDPKFLKSNRFTP